METSLHSASAPLGRSVAEATAVGTVVASSQMVAGHEQTDATRTAEGAPERPRRHPVWRSLILILGVAAGLGLVVLHLASDRGEREAMERRMQEQESEQRLLRMQLDNVSVRAARVQAEVEELRREGRTRTVVRPICDGPACGGTQLDPQLRAPALLRTGLPESTPPR
jgi:hypothetical protein